MPVNLEYDGAECPDCGEPIPDEKEAGDKCDGCDRILGTICKICKKPWDMGDFEPCKDCLLKVMVQCTKAEATHYVAIWDNFPDMTIDLNEGTAAFSGIKVEYYSSEEACAVRVYQIEGAQYCMGKLPPNGIVNS